MARLAISLLQDRQIRQRLLRLPAAPVPCPQWQRLADHVSVWGPQALHSALDRRLVPVPDVEGAQRSCCLLTSSQNARRFRNPHVNEWLAELFLSIPGGMQAVSLPKVTLLLVGRSHKVGNALCDCPCLPLCR